MFSKVWCSDTSNHCATDMIDKYYVIRINKMHTFYINVLIQLQCLRHVWNIQVFIIRKACTCSFMVFLSYIHISSLVDPLNDQTAYMDT